jgi:predicted Zn-dependent protease
MPKHFTWCVALWSLLAVLALPTQGAKVAPITDLEVLPENEEEAGLWEVSREHEQGILDRGERYGNPEVEAFLADMARRMLGTSLDRHEIAIEFFIVRRPTLSAWVYPYGKVAVTTGLLAGMDNDSQLAAIIGHELAHFIDRHSYRELIADKRQSAVGKGLGFLATALVAKQTGVIDTRLMKTGQIWTDLVTSGYSRELEHDADAEGLALMAAGQYTQREAVPAFEALAQNDLYGVVDVAAIWSSHPKLADRIENLRAAIADSTQVAGPIDTNAYRRALATVFVVNAQLDMNEHHHEHARATLARVLEAAPDNGWAQFFYGETWRREQPDGPDLSPRIEAYARAISADPDLAPAHRELGMAYRQQGATADAIAAFDHYLTLASDAPDAGIVRSYRAELAGGTP